MFIQIHSDSNIENKKSKKYKESTPQQLLEPFQQRQSWNSFITVAELTVWKKKWHKNFCSSWIPFMKFSENKKSENAKWRYYSNFSNT